MAGCRGQLNRLGEHINAELERLTTPAKPDACPQCGSKDFVPIAYGFPTEGTAAEARAGKCVLGGCMLRLDGPHWYCKACEHSWPNGWSDNDLTE